MRQDFRRIHIIFVWAAFFFLPAQVYCQNMELDSKLTNSNERLNELNNKKQELESSLEQYEKLQKNSKKWQQENQQFDKCREAKTLLSERFNKKRVENALKKTLSCKDIERRLRDYGKKTDNLRASLSEVRDTMMTKTQKDFIDYPTIRKDKFIDKCFRVLLGSLDQELLEFDPEKFPYLYDVLREAMDAIMEHSIEKMEKCIEKL